MNIKVIGKFPSYTKEIETILPQFGLHRSSRPEAIITYGGDGTYLIAERKYPGIPKLLLRKSKGCNTCFTTNISSALKQLGNGNYKIIAYTKITANKRIAVNDIVIANRYPNQALRYEVTVGKRKYSSIIGDGVVIATPFGSSAYYQAITRTTFTKGIGIAFNNTVSPLHHKIIPITGKIMVKITRGYAWVSYDNDTAMDKISSGDTITVGHSKEKALIISL